MVPTTDSYTSILRRLYPENNPDTLASDLIRAIGHASERSPHSPPSIDLAIDEKTALLICYGDSLLPGTPPSDGGTEAALGVGGGVDSEGQLLPPSTSSQPPLRALKEFADRCLNGIFSGLHILPFFPYTSDDGFSVTDYFSVNPRLGTWEDIQKIGADYDLMSDLVLNHCSAKGPWFQGYIQGQAAFEDFFIDLPPNTDTSLVVRPRTHPLLTPTDGLDTGGRSVRRHIWTTFSADQVDLNFANPRVLVEMVRALFTLVARGTRILRLDAIAYLWKELGTPCIHHEKTHLVVKLLRRLLDDFAPGTLLITETNVPHAENVSYFGDGTDEAQMIYQFSLPPLILHSFLTESARTLSDWARTIKVGPQTTYFNFASSHDGIGLTPTDGILDDAEREALVRAVESRGGSVNYKAVPGGQRPYELCSTYFAALTDPALPQDQRVRQFLASQAILLVMPGVPGIYIHSLLASPNFSAGRELTGANRTLNREKLFLEQVLADLGDSASLRCQVYNGYAAMLLVRRRQSAFHPCADMEVLDSGRTEVFALRRRSKEQSILCLINTSRSKLRVPDAGKITKAKTCIDLLSGRHFSVPGGDFEFLDAWEVRWLEERR